MDLSVIIVNWNSFNYLRKCLRSIHVSTQGLSFEVIVIDNASYDGCGKMLAEEFPQMRFVQSTENLGFARANNLGFEQCTGRNLLFLNPDTEVVGPALEGLVAALDSDPYLGMVGPKLLNSDLTVQTSCIQPFPTILNQLADFERLRLLSPKWKLWGMRPLFEDHQGRPVEVDAISGACIMIKREVFQRIGLFSTDYFMYAEDLDLCYKVRQAGGKVCYLGSASIIHHGGQSSKQKGDESFAAPLMREALLKFLQKTRGSTYAAIYRAAVLLVAILRLAILGVALALPVPRVGKVSIRWSLRKWYKVLRWSVGLEPWTKHSGHARNVDAAPVKG
jgi:hypothetical protein